MPPAITGITDHTTMLGLFIVEIVLKTFCPGGPLTTNLVSPLPQTSGISCTTMPASWFLNNFNCFDDKNNGLLVQQPLHTSDLVLYTKQMLRKYSEVLLILS
jgi:hypothetical protein